MRKPAVLVVTGCAVLAAACGSSGSSHKSASPTTTLTTPGSVATTPGPPTTAPVVPTTLAGPASSTAPSGPPATPVASEGDGTKYVAIVTPLTDALESAPASPTAAQFDQFAAGMRSAQSQLSAVTWPGQAEADIRTLVSEMGPLAAEMARGDAGAVRSAANALTTASVTIRSDLGLPTNTR